MRTNLQRRKLLMGSGALVLAGALHGCAAERRLAPGAGPMREPLHLLPIRASTDRITRITVCTRPFRPTGPRIEVERIVEKNVVHNYGHGGSGWSLSWGSSSIATTKALASGEHEFGVIGCGALGLTSALLLQRAGARVTIYAKELPPNTRSSLATGLYTPDSRICLEEHASADFKRSWEQMARFSYQFYQSFLGVAGTPVEFIDSYMVSDDKSPTLRSATDPRPAFAELQRELIADLIPKPVEFEPGSHNLGVRHLQRNGQLMFNLASYQRLLVSEFYERGGHIEVTEFHVPADLSRLRERTLINATGFGARALFGDASIVPVRGQLARGITQPDINYGLFYKGISFVPRRDGLVYQAVGENDYYGYNDATTLPDAVEAQRAVSTIGSLFA